MHSCGVTRNIRKGYAIASFHSFGSSHGVECRDAAVRVAAENDFPAVTSSELDQLTPLLPDDAQREYLKNSDGQTSSKNLRRVRDQTLSYPCLGHHSLERSRNVGRPDFLDICSSGSAVGCVCAVAYQNQHCEVFSGRHPGRNHWRPGGAPVARFAGPSRHSSRVHSRDAERSLRSSFQDIAVEPGSILCTER